MTPMGGDHSKILVLCLVLSKFDGLKSSSSYVADPIPISVTSLASLRDGFLTKKPSSKALHQFF